MGVAVEVLFLQRSPVRIEQSCMLWHMLGLMNDRVGNLRLSRGKALNGRIDACRQVGEVNPRIVLAPIATRHASCEAHLRQGLRVAGEAESRGSERWPKLSAFGNRWGHALLVRPWVDPESSAR